MIEGKARTSRSRGTPNPSSQLFSHHGFYRGRMPFLNNLMKRYRAILRRRSAFAMTDTELNVMAALAIIGLKRTPTNG